MKHAAIPPGARQDRLSGTFIIFQPEHGQHYTTDDMLVAWLSVQTVQEAAFAINDFLDLGAGLCSVPMMLLWACPRLRGLGIESIRQRLFLGRQSLAANNLLSRFHLIQGDLRDIRLRRSFPLVTSSPPYYKTGEGLLSPDHNRASVRFELQGGIEDYFHAASDHLAPGGFFTTVYPRQYARRVFSAAEKFDFHLERQIDIVPRQTKPPLITLFSFRRTTPGKGVVTSLTVRGSDQYFTGAFKKIRREMGFPEKSS